jgi:hypothetical protein
MKLFVRVAAVLVAWGNVFVPQIAFPNVAGNPVGFIEFVQSLGWWGVLQRLFFGAVLGAVAGLLTAEVLLRTMRPLLEGGFLARYVAMGGAVYVGGMLYGALLPFFGVLFSGVRLDTPGMPDLLERILAGLGAGMVGAFVGAGVGVAEGLILGLPLAAILGLFRNGH